MEKLKQLFFHSVMNYINLSLFTIVGIALLSIFFSFWITEKTDNDAKAINLSGSMRMQTFHIGMAIVDSPQDVMGLIKRLDTTWQDPLFNHLHADSGNPFLAGLFDKGYQNWFEVIRPTLIKELEKEVHDPALYSQLSHQVDLTDALVSQLQHQAEEKIRSLRSMLLFSLLITTLVGSLIFYLLKNRVEAPLKTLTTAALEIGDGKIEQHIPMKGDDELALLGQAFNQMSRSISETYSQLENRVAERTRELQRNNTILEFLFRIAREVLDNQGLDYQKVIKELSGIIGYEDMELCLFTPEGDRPYLQVDARNSEHPCQKLDCGACKGSAPFDQINTLCSHHNYPIVQDEKQYGVIQVRSKSLESIGDWQDKLLRSTADQFAIALSLNETHDQEHRLAMLNERTVIARVLHDSLAQSLSYLQIQVTRLQKTRDQEKYALQQPIIDELREGLSSAYRHLRELLTTFRLKMDGEGLEGALRQTLDQIEERTKMTVKLNYELRNLPLNPSEEIHLLQVAREASQNAINHSEGTTLTITLRQLSDKNVELSVVDDGVGLSDSPEKLNHYGLAIMQERSKHLHGELAISPGEPHGTEVRLSFLPSYLREAA